MPVSLGLTVRVNRKSSDRLFRQLERMLYDETQAADARGIIVRRTAQQLQEDVQDRMLSGGRGKWKPLSQWTVARTGRTQPLRPLAGLVRRRFRQGRAEVYFQSPSDKWSLTSHHKGFHVTATQKYMRIPLLRGAVVLHRRKPYNVPAREVWPSERTAVTVLNRNIRRFIQHLEHGSSTTFPGE